MRVQVIGAGLAGCEAAYRLAEDGIQVDLFEMKPEKYTPAHHYSGFAELVCSNSLKAARLGSAAGLLKHEMKRLGSLVIPCAEACSVAAGGALAVDREKFSDLVTEKVKAHPNIWVHAEEVVRIPEEGYVVIATGPLTSDALAADIQRFCGGTGYLSFYDAAAPIVTAESVDMEHAFLASRYDRGEADYINCPMNKEEYEHFYHELVNAEAVSLKSFEQGAPAVYEGCMPVEIMAKRGEDTLRFGPLKPVGLRDPRTGHRPWANLQLRKENAGGSMYNLVGFQTNLKFGEQKRVFGLIPALKNAEYVRYGVMHRNTFLDSPRLLDNHFRLKHDPRISFAGQMTGVEGYVESAASGLYVGFTLSRFLRGEPEITLPANTMLGALANYIADKTVADFQPMGCNMGILPPLPERIRDKQARYQMIAERAMDSLEQTLDGYGV